MSTSNLTTDSETFADNDSWLTWPLLIKIQTYAALCAYLPLFIIGVIGNTLNLVVLLSREMRSHTNIMLAAMAFADLAFLIVSTPTNMIRIADKELRYFLYVHLTHHLIGVTNWCSAASAWLVVTVSVERLLAILMPLRVRYFWNSKRIFFYILLVAIFTRAITWNEHINRAWDFKIVNGSNVPNIIVKRPPTNVDLHVVFNTMTAILAIIVPELLLIVSNSLLIVTLHRQSSAFSSSTAQKDTSKSRANNNAVQTQREASTLLNHYRNSTVNGGTCQVPRRRSSSVAGTSKQSHGARANEFKVAVTVVAIVTCFTVTQVPSAIVAFQSVLEVLSGDTVQPTPAEVMRRSFYTLCSNILVCCGKVLNFFLFCTSSANFRRKVRTIFSIYQNRSRQRLMSFMTNSTRVLQSSNEMLDMAGPNAVRSSSALHRVKGSVAQPSRRTGAAAATARGRNVSRVFKQRHSLTPCEAYRDRQFSIDSKVVRALTAQEIAAEEEVATLSSDDSHQRRSGSLPRIFENDDVPL